jgi:transcriptional regulator with XRE-family HTH domain
VTEAWTGARATALRKALRLTIDQFANRLGMSPRGVAHWRANPDVVPRVAQWDRLDDLLDNASPAARKRFEELTSATTASNPTPVSVATSPEDVLGLFEAIDDVYAEVADREHEEEEWTLPPGAKPVDCVAFGAMDNAVKELLSRVDLLERRVAFLTNKLLDREANR